MPAPAPQPPTPEPSRSGPQQSEALPPSIPKPEAREALFRALVDAGADAVVAYTADRQMHAVTLETVTASLQPVLVEIGRRFDEQDRKLDEQDRKLDEHGRRLDEHDRKLDVIVARLDGLKVLVHVVLGALGLLITVLIAVFGFLFTNGAPG